MHLGLIKGEVVLENALFRGALTVGRQSLEARHGAVVVNVHMLSSLVLMA